jgi:hypothetical protein
MTIDLKLLRNVIIGYKTRTGETSKRGVPFWDEHIPINIVFVRLVRNPKRSSRIPSNVIT